MKITAVKTFLCNCYRTNWVFVKIETNTGPWGWGEATRPGVLPDRQGSGQYRGVPARLLP